MARKLAAVVFSLGCIQASSVMALGLGELELQSFLNEPLRASVDLLNTGGLHEDEIKIRLATREDFDKLGLDRAYFLTSIKFDVEVDSRGRAKILMSSEEPVLEPYLDFVVEARWPSGKLLREYTVLIDPPAFSAATPTVSASARVEEVEGIPPASKKKSSVGASSGTTVNVKKSTLAPGAMPQRNFNSSASAAPAPGTRYMVARDQTLWEIASQARPRGASVYQTMLDIQRLNPDAFLHGNINRLKAGYIIYLPSSDDISSQDLEAALAEVRQQHEAWRTGREAEYTARGKPALRISAEEGDTGTARTGDATVGSGGSGAVAAGADTATPGSGDPTAAVSGVDAERVAAMAEQLETMERIVALKDEQIAALQATLAEQERSDAATDGAETEEPADQEAVSPVATQDDESVATGADPTQDQVTASPEPGDDELRVGPGGDTTVSAPSYEGIESATEATVEQAPKKVDKPVDKPKETSTPSAKDKREDEGRGWRQYLPYGLGAAALAGLGLWWARRRSHDDDEDEYEYAEAEDAFSDVELNDQAIDTDPELPEPTAPAFSEKAEDVLQRTSRGYGEHRHDEYASDVEAADALAEADIYIAYGRHPQAIDLLNNALASEPNNPVYRLKLLEIYKELGDKRNTDEQLHQLRGIGDDAAIAKGEAMLAASGAVEATEDDIPAFDDRKTTRVDAGPGLSPNPLQTESPATAGPALTDSDTTEGEADFIGLEIEGDDSADDELDLSADFVDIDDDDDDDLVIAAEGDGMSTKLDLARAYLDMGDEDGARQILEEVIAEGGEDVKAEAVTLLERIG